MTFTENINFNSLLNSKFLLTSYGSQARIKRILTTSLITPLCFHHFLLSRKPIVIFSARLTCLIPIILGLIFKKKIYLIYVSDGLISPFLEPNNQSLDFTDFDGILVSQPYFTKIDFPSLEHIPVLNMAKFESTDFIKKSSASEIGLCLANNPFLCDKSEFLVEKINQIVDMMNISKIYCSYLSRKAELFAKHLSSHVKNAELVLYKGTSLSLSKRYSVTAFMTTPSSVPLYANELYFVTLMSKPSPYFLNPVDQQLMAPLEFKCLKASTSPPELPTYFLSRIIESPNKRFRLFNQDYVVYKILSELWSCFPSLLLGRPLR